MKGRVSEPEEADIARQWLNKHAPTATDIHTIEKVQEAVFSIYSMQWLYNEDQWDKINSYELEASSSQLVMSQ